MNTSATTIPVPRPLAPAEGATVAPDTVTFSWEPVEGAAKYALEISTAAAFGEDAQEVAAGNATSITLKLGGKDAARSLWWRVKATTYGGSTSQWSQTVPFRMERNTTASGNRIAPIQVAEHAEYHYQDHSVQGPAGYVALVVMLVAFVVIVGIVVALQYI